MKPLYDIFLILFCVSKHPGDLSLQGVIRRRCIYNDIIYYGGAQLNNELFERNKRNGQFITVNRTRRVA